MKEKFFYYKIVYLCILANKIKIEKLNYLLKRINNNKMKQKEIGKKLNYSRLIFKLYYA